MAKTRIMLRRHEGATVSMIAAPTGEVATLATLATRKNILSLGKSGANAPRIVGGPGGTHRGGGWGSSLPLARRIRRTCFTISSITSAKLFMPPAGARLWGGQGTWDTPIGVCPCCPSPSPAMPRGPEQQCPALSLMSPKAWPPTPPCGRCSLWSRCSGLPARPLRHA